ncbi:hypothetical protein PTKIN_Ptkin17bG0138200 [Pterospermum kingtungense]
MLEEMRVYTMERIKERRDFCSKWRHNYGHLIKKRFDEYKKDGVEWSVHWNGEGGCEVKKRRLQYTVNLKKKQCSCRGWQLSGIPYAHACCAIWHDEGDLDDYVSKWFHPQTFLKAYKFALQPINGPHEWKRSGLEPILPPLARKMSGRPKTTRKKLKGEPKTKGGHLSRASNINTCSLCKKEGHNKRRCPFKASGSVKEPTIEKNKGKQPSMEKSRGKRSAMDKNKGKQPANEKEKVPMRETGSSKPIRIRKPSIKGYGLLTNLKTGQRTWHGLTSNRGITIGGPSSNNPPPLRKRKASKANVRS